MITWDPISFFIGLLLGMIIMLIIVWIAYNTRSFIFTYCPASSVPGCRGVDYYNDPGEALSHDPRLTASDILFLNQNEELMYVRVPRTTGCIPESNQTIQIVYPQYCQFSNDGKDSITYKQTYYGSNIYQPQSGAGSSSITTAGNCIPNSIFNDGIPLIKWDPAHLPG